MAFDDEIERRKKESRRRKVPVFIILLFALFCLSAVYLVIYMD